MAKRELTWANAELTDLSVETQEAWAAFKALVVKEIEPLAPDRLHSRVVLSWRAIGSGKLGFAFDETVNRAPSFAELKAASVDRLIRNGQSIG
jgi:hypothetical protein